MDKQATEAIAKAAIEYLISQGKEYEAKLLQSSTLSIDQTGADVAFAIGADKDIMLFDYALTMFVAPDHLD